MHSIVGQMDAKGKHFAVIVSRWNELVTKELLEGALEALKRHGDPEVEVVHVPGTWEIPVAAKALLVRGANRPDALVALGCILQGQTPHAALLGADVGSALMGLQVESGIPIAWGVLTPDTQEQALERAGLKHGNKGREAALAAIEMASVVEQTAGAKAGRKIGFKA
jgi:6,7-dimethyl-8-ribityllumazine synthase